MPTVVEQRERHGHWRVRAEKRVATPNRGRSAYGLDSGVRADEDVEQAHDQGVTLKRKKSASGQQQGVVVD